MIRIAAVVEGHGDVSAVPVLVRRIAQEIAPGALLITPPAIRIPKGTLVKPEQLERAVELAARKVAPAGGVLIVVDADDDCPRDLGPELLTRARAARGDRALSVVVPVREFEAWFVGRAQDLRGYKGIAADLVAPPQPESIRGAKEWLSARMTEARYSEPVDQPAMADLIDLQGARYMGSFDKLYRDISAMVTALV